MLLLAKQKKEDKKKTCQMPETGAFLPFRLIAGGVVTSHFLTDIQSSLRIN